MSIDYTLWPNPNGNLGENKVQIPDGINTTWPEGDALVDNFVYKNGKISAFIDTKALVVNESKTTTFPYDYVNIHLESIQEGSMNVTRGERTKYFTVTYGTSNSGDTIVLGTKYASCTTRYEIEAIEPNYKTVDIVDGVWTESLSALTDGEWMFYNCPNLTTFTSDLSSLTNGSYMFNYCSNLTSFESNLSSLANGNSMFNYCSNLTSFDSNLSSLANGNSMFMGCFNLTSFDSNLNSLIEGYFMFGQCSNLTSFDSNLSSLANGNSMFMGCFNLTSFNSDLSSLIYGAAMFDECTGLTSFNSDLGSLTNGSYMFYGCKLDTTSVQNIARTIKDVNGMENQGECDMVWRYIHIDIDNTTPNSEEIEAFNLISSKGWTVYVNGNEHSSASPASVMTLDETGEEISTPIPFYAKPQQTDEKHARYIDSEGNFFIILGAQFIYGDDISTYGMFINEEDAAANMGLTKIERA